MTEDQSPLLVTTELCFMMEMIVSHLQEINSPQESVLSSELEYVLHLITQCVFWVLVESQT